MCVRRLNRSVFTDTVIKHLESNMIPVHSCFTVGPSSKPAAEGDEPLYERHYTVMRICVSEADVSKVMA